jgi:hypothetical protein
MSLKLFWGLLDISTQHAANERYVQSIFLDVNPASLPGSNMSIIIHIMSKLLLKILRIDC